MNAVSKFTLGQNIKQLAKLGLVNDSITRKTMRYCINYAKIEDWKEELDALYNSWIKNKDKMNPTNSPCPKDKG